MRIPFLSNYLDYRKEIKHFQRVGKDFVDGSITLMDFAQNVSGYTGDKFFKGFGITKDFQVVDLKILQYRSIQLLRENLYTNALIDRLETNVVNKGLTLSSAPIFDILGKKFDLSDDWLREWARKVESRWAAWSRDARYVSHDKQSDFSRLEKFNHRTALVSGDCLNIISINSNGLPVLQLIDGFYVSQPLPSTKTIGKRIKHGITLDKKNREIEYWVEDNKGGHVAIQAYGRGSGRRRAWLSKGSQQRLDDLRGIPAISIGIQNLNEAGKYLDSEQRASLVNSMVAMTRHRDKNQGPSSSGFRQRGSIAVSNKSTETAGDVRFEQQSPGMYLANLSPGETVESYDTKRPNQHFDKFMQAVLKPIAYSKEIPPEIFFMEYGNNFSASRQAHLDWQEVLKKKVHEHSRGFNDLVFVEFLTGEVLNGGIEAPGYVESLQNEHDYAVRNAWQNTQWHGLPQTSVDIKKLVQALEIVEQKGWLTNEKIASLYFSTDWFDNMRRKKTENESIVNAMAPIRERLEVETTVDGENVTTIKAEELSIIQSKILELSMSIEELESIINDGTEAK